MNYYIKMESPVGELTLVSDGKFLTNLVWGDDMPTRKPPKGLIEKAIPLLKKAKKQLSEYFQSQRKKFDIPLSMTGTDFQKKVWEALQKIPYGTTTSYGNIAEIIGSPKACRAVGAANGRNPIPIIVPCHRVIGMNGNLTGFGGGLETKAILLSLEENKLF